MSKAIVLLSGGLDSAILLAAVIRQGKHVHTLSFDYGQRNAAYELTAAEKIAKHYLCTHQTVKLDCSSFHVSSLLNPSLAVPKNRSAAEVYSIQTPNTYVPARNTIFLAYALGLAESTGAEHIYYGCMGEDGAYADCRPEYINAMQVVFDQAMGQPGKVTLHTPFIRSSKVEILQLAIACKVPMHYTFSCYSPTVEGLHCWSCDACQRRQRGFEQIGIEDPLSNLSKCYP